MIGRFVNRILLLVNVLAIIGLVLCYASAHLNPLQFSLITLFSLTYPYFVAINIGFILFWAVIRKYYLIFSLIALLFGYNSLNNNFQFLPKNTYVDTVPGITFKVMSYNVHIFDLYRWSKKGETRDKMFEFIRSENPNIACFQEYYNGKKNFYPVHDSLMMNQNFRYAHVYYTDNIGVLQRFGIATYSTYPIVNKGIIRFPNTRNVSIYSDIKIKNDTIRVFNCHLESIRFLPEDYNFIDSLVTQRDKPQINGAKGVKKRLENAFKKRAVQTHLLTEQIVKSPYPIVLAGDFNDPPSSYTYTHLTESLNDSFVEKGKGKGATFSRNIFAYRIDYILYSKHLQCIDFYVPKVDYSDHFPIIGNYKIPAKNNKIK